MTATETSIYERLRKVQVELKAPKSQYNSFGKYSYRNVEDIMEALKPLLAKHELTLVVADAIELIGERYYVKAEAHVFDGVTELAAFGYAREEETKKGMDGAQITGAASSYARKYALNGLFAIDDTKDADSQDNRTQGPESGRTTKPAVGSAPKPVATNTPPATEPPITAPQLKRMQAMFTEAGYGDRENRLEFVQWVIKRNVTSSSELTKNEASKVMDALEHELLEGGDESEAA